MKNRKRGPNSKVLVSTPNLFDGGSAQIAQHPLPDGRVRVWVEDGTRSIEDISRWPSGWEIVFSAKREADEAEAEDGED